jgi:protoheme IX farnesyltransferase
MLPVVAPPRVVTRNIVIYAVVMVIASLALIPIAPMGWVYGIGAVVLGFWFVAISFGLVKRSHRENADYEELQKPAMRVFHGSITYLALLFLLIGLTPFLP